MSILKTDAKFYSRGKMRYEISPDNLQKNIFIQNNKDEKVSYHNFKFDSFFIMFFALWYPLELFLLLIFIRLILNVTRILLFPEINDISLFCFQAAHSDIESHGQLIKTTVELCEKYSSRSYRQKSQSLNYASRQRQSIRHQQRVINYSFFSTK